MYVYSHSMGLHTFVRFCMFEHFVVKSVTNVLICHGCLCFFCLYCVHKQLPFIFQTIKNMQRIVNSLFLNNVVKNDTIVGFVMLYVCMYI